MTTVAQCLLDDSSKLGTHSARLITLAHGGEISFTTSKAKGTHLLVRLPAGVDGSAANAAKAASAASA